MKLGIDTGGTFTDLIGVDARTNAWYTAKVPSTPKEPLVAILNAIDSAGVDLPQVDLLILGTTVGTNVLLERKGANVLFLTTDGFEDIPHIQRGNRKFHYDLHWRKPHPFVERRNCLGVKERVDYRGAVAVPLDLEDPRLSQELPQRVETERAQAIAVSLLFSYLNPDHEERLGSWLQERFPDLEVSLSHRVAPVWREYERGLTTIADAYLKPLLKDFITTVDVGLRDRGFKGTWALMKSNGGNRLAKAAAEEPVQLLLSGLAGGVIGGKIFGLEVDRNLITLDMGGTSCDIAVITDAEQRYGTQFEVEFGLPLTLPIIDVTTIGAGGGSIGWIDGGGFLRVGPRSAGADPGPACYGRGGKDPTVTDANLVLGRLSTDYFLGGAIELDSSLARKAIALLGRSLELTPEETALAIIDIANDNMMNAIRLRTVEVGIDPGDYSLVAFGGAGSLHSSAIARRLGIHRVVVPPHPGLCSAFGALAANLRTDKVWTAALRSDNVRAEEIDRQIQRLSDAVVEELRTEGFQGNPRVTAKLALRYLGQNYEHDVELPRGTISDAVLGEAFKRFNSLHDEFYGYNLSGQVIEIVNLSVTAVGPTEQTVPSPVPRSDSSPETIRKVYFDTVGGTETAVRRRDTLAIGATLRGPAIIEELDATTLVEPGDRVTVADNGSLLIEIV